VQCRHQSDSGEFRLLYGSQYGIVCRLPCTTLNMLRRRLHAYLSIVMNTAFLRFSRPLLCECSYLLTYLFLTRCRSRTRSVLSKYTLRLLNTGYKQRIDGRKMKLKYKRSLTVCQDGSGISRFSITYFKIGLPPSCFEGVQ